MRIDDLTRVLAVACGLVLVVGTASVVVLDDGGDAPIGAWHELAAPPLAPRTSVVSAWTGTEVVLVGGQLDSCPPSAACSGPVSGLADGAVLDVATATWRSMAPAPVAFATGSAAVLDGVAYVLATSPEPAMLAYDLATDTWSTLPLPYGAPQLGDLVATDRAVVAWSRSDEAGEIADQVYDPASAAWTALPDDPLSPGFSRSMAWSAPDLYLFDHEIVPNPGSTSPSFLRGARYDPGTGAWERLPDSESLGGFLAPTPWYAEDGLLVNPTLTPADELAGPSRGDQFGAIFDTTTLAWRPLPPAPAIEFNESGNGVVGRTGGLILSNGAGPLLDLATMTWVAMPASDDAVTAQSYDRRIVIPAGREAVAFGGIPGPYDGNVLEHAWLWRSG